MFGPIKQINRGDEKEFDRRKGVFALHSDE
jgi:hypothetical protein